MPCFLEEKLLDQNPISLSEIQRSAHLFKTSATHESNTTFGTLRGSLALYHRWIPLGFAAASLDLQRMRQFTICKAKNWRIPHRDKSKDGTGLGVQSIRPVSLQPPNSYFLSTLIILAA